MFNPRASTDFTTDFANARRIKEYSDANKNAAIWYCVRRLAAQGLSANIMELSALLL